MNSDTKTTARTAPQTAEAEAGGSHGHKAKLSLLDRDSALIAIGNAFKMLRPSVQWKNPVMFVVEIGTLLTFLYIIRAAVLGGEAAENIGYFMAIAVWLLLTILFANFATALAEARGKAQADSLRRTRKETTAYRLGKNGSPEAVASSELKPGDKVIVEAGQVIPGDGEVIEGVASVDESAITGESAPVIRAAGSDRSGVTGGTLVLSDRIVVQITSARGESFLDKMIALVEGSIRQRSPNEIALALLLSGLTLVFLIVVFAIWPMARNAEGYMASYLGVPTVKSLGTDVPTLIALIVCLIPTTIGALLAAIGIAGMDRSLQANVLAKSGKAVELAGDIDVVLLDKTGTITMGARHATSLQTVGGASQAEAAWLAAVASIADETPEGKSIVRFCAGKGAAADTPVGATFIPFSAQTRMSGVDLPGNRRIRKGALDAISAFALANGGSIPPELGKTVESVALKGATPLVVADGGRIVAVLELEDILKPNIRERFERLRAMGLRTVMITGDNPTTAATIAAKAGVDDYLAQATPEMKLQYIRAEQGSGKLVAMMGDGTNDAPALAQADVALAMNAGTQAAKEAANMVDLDSDPTKLIEVVEIGKQLLITRGSLTTFSIANDVAKYFAIIPAMFAGTLPWLKPLDIMNLHSPTSAILSAVIFNALIIPALIPVALKGVKYRISGAEALLRRNLFIWGLGGILLPFAGIKIIDLVMTALHLVA